MSTIQPTPPSAPTAPGSATTVARITSGAEALSNTRPGGTVQVQVVSVTPQGQVTLSAPGGQVQVQVPTTQPPPGQTTSQAPSQTPSQPTNQSTGQSTGQSPSPTAPQGQEPRAESAPARAPAALKPGDVYTLRTSGRGSETVTLSLQRSAPPAPTPPQTASPSPRAEGSVPTRLVPGAVTTATIIPRPATDAPPPNPPPRSAPPTPATAQASANAYAQRLQLSQVQVQQPQGTTPQPTSSGPAAPPLPQAIGVGAGEAVELNRPTSSTAGTPGLVSLAKAGTGALLRTALQAARAITDGAPRPVQAPTVPGGQGTPSGVQGGRSTSTQSMPIPATTAASAATTNPATQTPGPISNTESQSSAARVTSDRPPPQGGAQTENATARTAPLSTGLTSTSPTSNGSGSPRGTAPAASAAAPPTNTTATTAPAPQLGQAANARPTDGLRATTAQGNPPHTSPAPSGGQAGAASPVAGPGVNAAATAGASTATTTTGLIAQFTQVQRAEVRILSVLHPGATTTNAAPNPQGAQGAVIGGTVIGQSRSGQAILNTPRGLVTLAGQADFPPGSRVAIEILPLSSRAAAGTGTAAPPAAPLGHLAQHWETLDQAIRLLEAANPVAASQVTQNLVGRPGPQLTAAIALFITAVRGGDLRAWLGEETTRALDQLRGQVGTTLREEFGTLQRASEPTDSGWRAFFIPFLDNGQLNQVRLFLHQEDDTEGDAEDEDAAKAHFVVDLSLSQLGDLQIDGTVNPRTVDLLIRTRETLPDTMRQDIRDIFTTTLARTGIEGQLAFRMQKTFPALPIEELHGYQDSPSSDLHI